MIGPDGKWIAFASFDGKRSLDIVNIENPKEIYHEQLLFGKGKTNAQLFVASQSQMGHWTPPYMEELKSSWLLGLVDAQTLVAWFDSGAYQGVFWINLSARGKDPNQKFLLPTKERYLPIHWLSGKLLVLHSQNRHSVLETWSVALKGGLRREKLGSSVQANLFSSGTQVLAYDPIGRRVLYSRRNQSHEYVVASHKSRAIRGDLRTREVCYFNGELYDSGNWRLRRWDRKSHRWMDLGPYTLMGASSSGKVAILRSSSDGLLWKVTAQ